MEHHYDSYTQTQQQTPLGDHTSTHHDKKLESPTCTDFDNNNLENLQLGSTMEQSLDGTYPYHNQQSVTLASADSKTILGQHYESIGDEDDQVIPPPLNNLAAGPHSLQGPGDIDETVDSGVLEPRTWHDSTGDDPAHVFAMADTTNVAAEITTDNNTQQDEPPSSENDSTVPTETSNNHSGDLESNDTTSMDSSDVAAPLATTSNEQHHHHVNIESLGTAAHHPDDGGDAINNDDNGEMKMDDGNDEMQQRDAVDQLNTNMTSGDDKGGGDKNCIMNQSVDHVDTSSCDRVNSPLAMDRSTETSTTNQQLDPTHHNDTQSTYLHSQHSLGDNTSDTLDHTMTTTENSTTNTIESPALEIASSPPPPPATSPHILEQNDATDATEENDHDQVEQHQQVQLGGDEHILDDGVAQQQDIGQSISTAPEAASASISTEPLQPSHSTSDDHQLNRTNTTGSDEHTLSEALRPRHVWESDRQASECRRCNRRFSFLVRRHHCRRCGQIVCDRCSSHRVRLPVEEIVEDPLISTSHYPMIALNPQRVCESCIRIPIKASEPTSRYASSSQNNSNHQAGQSTLGFGHHRLRPMNMERTNSQQSLMADCPVCGTGLLGMGKQQQENHLNQCLNAGSPTVRPPRYIIYTLTDGTAQLGDECPICFEEFQVGDKIARMVCLCSYHRHCLRDWLERGKGCPIHYDSYFGAY